LVAVPISTLHPSFIMWFRPEVIHTVNWGGDPKKPTVSEIDMRIHPRKSFETWKENVRDQSAPWSVAEVQSAAEFRNAVVNFVLKRAEERAELTEELQRSNKELESFSYSISHDLRAPFRHILGYAQLLGEEEDGLKAISRHYLTGISNAALSAGQLVDDLLRFSQLGRASLNMSSIDMQKVAGEVQRSFENATDERRIEWRIGALPVGYGDAPLVRQAIYNLADNAVKYTRDRDPAIIEIEGRDEGDRTVYTVRDNGVGFDMAYGGKLFQVFQRLHHIEDFEGTGIGLALTKRIIDRHGGSISADGKLNEGASFSFTLPKPRKGRP
jgi:chemotaxis family two-component system sensor kinase Cph1